MLGAEKVADQVDFDDSLPAFERKFFDRAGQHDAGIGHHDIKPAKFGHSLIDECGHLLFVGDVGGNRTCLSPRRSRNLFGGDLRLLGVQVGYDNVGAFLGQPQANFAPQALGAAGDDGDLIQQWLCVHRRSRWCMMVMLKT